MSVYFQNRLDKLLNEINNLGYDGMYITNMTNIRYLTGFTGSAAILLIANENAYFLTDGRYIEQSKNEVQNAEVFIIKSNYFDSISDNKLLPKKGASIAFEG